MLDWLKTVTKDTFSTLAGLVGGVALGAAAGAAQSYSQGGVTKEALMMGAAAGAVPVITGYLHNKGNTEPRFK